MEEARELLENGGKNTVHDKNYASQCMAKWDYLLKGIPTDHDQGWTKQCTAVLLENEMDYARKYITEDTLSTNAGSYTKHIFPILRRVWPNLIANQIVSVQPMSAPAGGVVYFERVYEDAKGSKIPQGSITNNPTDMSYGGKLSAGDNINQNFAKYYGSEFVDYDDVCTDTGTATTGALTQASANCRTPNWSPIRANGTDGQRTFTVTATYRMLDADAASADTTVIATMNNSGNFVDNTANTNTVGTFNTTTGNWSINAAGSAGTNSQFTNNTVIYLQYYVNWELVGYTTGAEVPSIGLNISVQSVKAEPYKLKARWTIDAADDIEALHGMNAEEQLTTVFSNEIMLQIDRSIISELVAGAAHAATYTYAATTPGEIETIRRLLTTISSVANRIHKSTGRAPANFVVVSPDVGALLEQLSTHGDYASSTANVQYPSYGPVMSNFGIIRIGTLQNKYAVYQDPYMTSNQILVGLKGNSFMDAGFAYCPYIPLQVTPSFFNPNDFTVTKGAYARHATKMLRPEYYGVITVSGLPTVTTTL